MLNIEDAIPLYMLNYDIKLYKRLDTQTENEYEEPILIKNVEFQNYIKESSNNNGEIIYSKAEIFIDYVNSKPFIIPKIGDKIEFRNINYFVYEVRELELYGEMHHLEVFVH